jgi:hypothetical protein
MESESGVLKYQHAWVVISIVILLVMHHQQPIVWPHSLLPAIAGHYARTRLWADLVSCTFCCI